MAPAVMVRIHPGQLFRSRLPTLSTFAWVGVILLGLGGAPCAHALAAPSVLAVPSVLVAPPAHAASPASAALQRQPEQGSPTDSAEVRSEAEGAQARFERIRRNLLPYV